MLRALRQLSLEHRALAWPLALVSRLPSGAEYHNMTYWSSDTLIHAVLHLLSCWIHCVIQNCQQIEQTAVKMSNNILLVPFCIISVWIKCNVDCMKNVLLMWILNKFLLPEFYNAYFNHLKTIIQLCFFLMLTDSWMGLAQNIVDAGKHKLW